MRFETKEFIERQYQYFGIGMGRTALLKYILAVIGINEAIQGLQTIWILIIGVSYAIFCYVLGYFLVYYEWIEANMNVNNKFNKLFRDMMLERKLK